MGIRNQRDELIRSRKSGGLESDESSVSTLYKGCQIELWVTAQTRTAPLWEQQIGVRPNLKRTEIGPKWGNKKKRELVQFP